MPYLRVILRHPVIVLLAAATITAALLVPLSGVQVDNSYEIWLLENDPGIKAYHDYQAEFQNDEYIIIGYEPPGGVLSPEGLALTERLTRRLAALDGVIDVTSITNVEEIRTSGDTLHVQHLVEPPLSDAERERVLHELTDDPLYAGTLAGGDGNAAALALKIEGARDRNYRDRWRFLDNLRDVLAQEDVAFHLTGGVIFDVEIYQVMVKDQKVLIPLMIGVFAVVLGILFRSVVGVVLPTVTVGVAVCWTFGLFALMGFTLNVASAILSVVLLAVGIADSVHFLSEYEEELAQGQPKMAAIDAAARTVFVPCLFTSVTTALGFLGLLLIRVAPLRQFGAFAALGTMLAFVATFTIVPAALALLPKPSLRAHLARSARDEGRGMRKIFDFVSAHRTSLLTTSVAVTLAGMLGLPYVHTSANWYGYLQKDNRTIQATDFVEDRIGGVYALEMLVTPRTATGKAGPGDESTVEPMKNVTPLREIEALEHYMEEDPLVQSTMSPVDFIKTMNRTMHWGDQAFYRIPDSREAIGQLLLMYELDAPDGALYDYVNFDFTRGRLTVRSKMSEAASHHRLIDRARRFAAKLGTVDVVPTGLLALYTKVEAYMLRGLVLGFCAAAVAVAIMMVLLLRTVRHGLLAMIPAVLPVLFVIGMTGWLDVALGTMPAMMGNVALGIAVDNAIHMLTRYRRLRAHGLSSADAIGQAVTVVGRPVLFTTLVLCLGFSVLGFSHMVPNQLFGVLTAVILFGSLVASIVTLPATVLVVDGWKSAHAQRRSVSPAPGATTAGSNGANGLGGSDDGREPRTHAPQAVEGFEAEELLRR